MPRHRATNSNLRNLLRGLKAVGLFILLCASVFLYAFKIEPGWVEIVNVSLTLPHLPSQFHGYRIVQISDVHADRWMQQARLSQIVEQINQQQPDLVAITGDFVTRDPTRFTQTLTSAFRQLQPQDGTVAVLGNHDHWSNPQAVAQALKQGNVSLLTNRVRSISRGSAQLQVAGVDDIWAGNPRLDRVLQ